MFGIARPKVKSRCSGLGSGGTRAIRVERRVCAANRAEWAGVHCKRLGHPYWMQVDTVSEPGFAQLTPWMRDAALPQVRWMCGEMMRVHGRERRGTKRRRRTSAHHSEVGVRIASFGAARICPTASGSPQLIMFLVLSLIADV